MKSDALQQLITTIHVNFKYSLQDRDAVAALRYTYMPRGPGLICYSCTCRLPVFLSCGPRGNHPSFTVVVFLPSPVPLTTNLAS